MLSCHGLLKCLLYSGVKGINSQQGINCLKFSWNELQALDDRTMHALLRIYAASEHKVAFEQLLLVFLPAALAAWSWSWLECSCGSCSGDV